MKPTDRDRAQGDAGKHLCWYCNEEAGIGHFCERCVKLQPLPDRQDYFALMGLERRMQLDPVLLEKSFYALSRKFHPDLYQNRSAEEKALSLERTALLNNAFQVLRDPIQRVEYLLHLECPLPERERAKAPTALLQEVFEIQEVLESYQQAKAAGDPQAAASFGDALQRASREVLEKIGEREKALQEASRKWDSLIRDSSFNKERLQEAKGEEAKQLRAILDEMTYLKTLLQSIQGNPIIH